MQRRECGACDERRVPGVFQLRNCRQDLEECGLEAAGREGATGVRRCAIQEHLRGAGFAAALLELRDGAQHGAVVRVLFAQLVEGAFGVFAVADDLLFDDGQRQGAIALFFRSFRACEQIRLQRERGGLVAQAPVHVHQARDGFAVVRVALQHFLVGELGAFWVGQRGVIQLAQATVDLRLALRLAHAARQTNQRLLA